MAVLAVRALFNTNIAAAFSEEVTLATVLNDNWFLRRFDWSFRW